MLRLFLSTLSLRRATSALWMVRSHLSFLSTLSLRRATFWSFVALKALEFLSTLSLRRATYDTYAKVLRVNISIHALLAESDVSGGVPSSCFGNFYPRSPCGERLKQLFATIGTTIFLSTLSLRRATSAQAAFPPGECISIHALLAESDAAMAAMAFTAAYFYPRSPCGERLCPDDKQADFCQFLSTLSLRRATALFGTTTSAAQFLSTLSLRRATFQCSHGAALLHISIHALLAESDGRF